MLVVWQLLKRCPSTTILRSRGSGAEAFTILLNMDLCAYAAASEEGSWPM